jgi:hypothetical protein
MPSAKKTWAEKMKANPPHQVILEKDFAGVPKGSKLHISSPAEIATELKTIAPGSIISIQELRRRLAEKNRSDATCPVSTSIFLRTVAEYTWEEFNRTGSTQIGTVIPNPSSLVRQRMINVGKRTRTVLHIGPKLSKTHCPVGTESRGSQRFPIFPKWHPQR